MPTAPRRPARRRGLVNVLVWHVHGSWTTAFVQGRHRYLVPTLPERGPWGGGRPAAWDWPAAAVETSPAELADADVDVVVLQRPEEIELAERWLGRQPGRDVAAVFLEHNAPRGGPAASSRHPMADRDDLLLVHVTHFNDLMWDSGTTPTTVVEHGIVDPGPPLHRRARRGGGVRQRAGPPGPGDRHGPAAAVRPSRTARRLRDGHRRAGRAPGLPGRPHGRRPAAAPHARRDGPAARVPAPAALDLARAVPAGGHAPGDAGGRAGDHRGARGGAAGRRGLLHGRRPAGARAARAGRRAGAGAGRWARPGGRTSLRPLRPRPVPHGLGRRPGPGVRTMHRRRRPVPRRTAEGGDADAHRDGVRTRQPAGGGRRGRRRRAERPRPRAEHGAGRRRARGDGLDPPRRRPHPRHRGAAPRPHGAHGDGGPAGAGAQGPSSCPTCPRSPASSAPTGRRERPDVVHAHFWMSGMAAVSAAAPLDLPVVQTFHALGSVKRRHQGADDTSPPGRVAAERAVAGRVDRVIATCTDEVFELARLGAPRRRTTVVPCGVDTAAFSPDGPVRPRSERPRLVVLGRLVRRKGVDEVIAALRRLPGRRAARRGRAARLRRALGRTGPRPRRAAAAARGGRGRASRTGSGCSARSPGPTCRPCCGRPTPWCACPGTSRSASCRWRRWPAGAPWSRARSAASRTPSSTR